MQGVAADAGMYVSQRYGVVFEEGGGWEPSFVPNASIQRVQEIPPNGMMVLGDAGLFQASAGRRTC